MAWASSLCCSFTPCWNTHTRPAAHRTVKIARLAFGKPHLTEHPHGSLLPQLTQPLVHASSCQLPGASGTHQAQRWHTCRRPLSCWQRLEVSCCLCLMASTDAPLLPQLKLYTATWISTRKRAA